MGNSDRVRCQTCSFGYSTLTLLYNSLFTVAIMSVDRFLYIYTPLKHDTKVTKIWILVPILIAWVVSLIIGLTSQAGPGDVNFKPVFLSCIKHKQIVYAFALIIIGVAALSVIMFCNVWIICIVLKKINVTYIVRKTSNKECMDSEQQQFNKSIQKARQRKQLNLFRVFGALLLSNAITWLPYISLIIALIAVNYDGVPPAFISFALVLFYSQGLVHPVVQTVFIADVREPLKWMITCGFIKKNHDSIPQEKCTCIHKNRDCCSTCFFLTAINRALQPDDVTNNIETVTT